jgi:hypothetical protein
MHIRRRADDPEGLCQNIASPLILKRRFSMSKSFFLAFILSIVCLVFSACSGGEKQESSATNRQPEKTSSATLTWNHIPIYPGAEQINAKVLMDLPKYQNFTTRFFKSQDGPDKIDAFYRNQMPLKGWESFAQAAAEKSFESEWGTGDRNTMCWVRIKEIQPDGGSEIEISRAVARK